MALASTASLTPLVWLLVFVGVVSWAVWRGTLSASKPLLPPRQPRGPFTSQDDARPSTPPSEETTRHEP